MGPWQHATAPGTGATWRSTRRNGAAAIGPEEAGAHFGWLAPVVAVDSPASSARARELVGWPPTRPGLLDDLDAGHYFRIQAAWPGP